MPGKYEQFGAFLDRCESPIEHDFLVALLFSRDYTFEPIVLPDRIARDATGVEIGMQVNVDGYRIDFTLSHQGNRSRFAIELDGQEFHSSPEHRERDSVRQRALTARGWTVLRFTGREIRRDARKCAMEAMRSAATMVPLDVPRPPVVDSVQPTESEWAEWVAKVQIFEAIARAKQGLKPRGTDT